jgi:dihydrofolate reductase
VEEWMSKLRVESFSVSIDGFGAGPNQSLDHPLGVGGNRLHEWLVRTATFQKMQGEESGSRGIDNEYAERGFNNIGAWILGRNMFSPVRGPWPDESWKGWWGENPPYHTPVFVLTHHPRSSISMEGGTTFHFVTGGIHVALERAMKAAGSEDVRVGGGVHTIRQYLQERLIDEIHLVISPVLLGSGENLFSGIDLPDLGYECIEHVPTENAMHIFLAKQ